MADDGLSSARETLRARSARNRRRQLANQNNIPDLTIEQPPVEEQLVVRLKDPTHLHDERPKSRLGQLNPFSRSTDQTFQTSKSSEFKETLKRPLSSLFRRPGSRAGRDQSNTRETNAGSDEIQEITSRDDISISRNRTSARNESFDKVPLNLDQIARAPEFTVNHVQDLYNFELPGFENPEIKKLDDIDLTPLIKFLQLEEEVADEPVPWTWDYLYANVVTESREEWDPDEDLPDNS
uniref:Uncharacterized protein n=2 Tax=Panagrolaimus sp. JU765 TaxID=591449 RepID=A0AC34QZK2_9BILA